MLAQPLLPRVADVGRLALLPVVVLELLETPLPRISVIVGALRVREVVNIVLALAVRPGRSRL